MIVVGCSGADGDYEVYGDVDDDDDVMAIAIEICSYMNHMYDMILNDTIPLQVRQRKASPCLPYKSSTLSSVRKNGHRKSKPI